MDVAFERRREPHGPDRLRKKEDATWRGRLLKLCLRPSDLKLGDVTLRRKMSCDAQGARR